jgi:hypothetical protein
MGTMREDFEAALDDSETDFNETQQEIITDDVQDSFQEEDQQKEGEPDNTSLETDDEPKAEAEAEASGSKDPEQKPDNEEKITDDKNKDSMKAPVDWSPSEREQWSKIPRNLQEKITAREKDMATQMAGTAQARQTHDYITQLGQSYAPVLAAEGAESPLHAVKSLFDTVASLRMGTPQDKANEMGRLIKHYGIDIQALDSVLSGQAPENNPNAQIEQMIDQRMAPVNQMLQMQKQQEQNQIQANQQTANRDVEQFSQTNEFLGDVRMDMADLIDMAAKQGRPLTLQQAYDRACSLNPEIAKIIDDRKKTESIMGNRQSLGHKRNAASSLNGRQIGTPSSDAMSMHDAIADAWDNAG